MTTRPRISDDVAATNPRLAHFAALRDRLAELQRRIGELLDRIEASPRTADGMGVVMNAATVALFAELARAAQEADEVSASFRALIAQGDSSH